MRIAQVLPSAAWGEVSPAKLEEGIGGREGALIRLSREWARSGHEVTNYVSTRNPTRLHEGEGFHEYVSIGMSRVSLCNIEYDAVVAWECPKIFNHPEIVKRQPVRLVEMQCAHLPSDEDRIAANTIVTGVVALSDWHRDFMVHDGLQLPDDRLHVLPNCVDLEHYPAMDDPLSKLDGPLRLFYSSSPDRGLWHLLRMWPMIRAKSPDAELRIAYGLKKWVSQTCWLHTRLGEMSVEIARLVSQPGVVDLGTLGHSDLARVQRESTMWVYPCDPISPTETGCITAIEAAASYCPMLLSNADCLTEEFGNVAVAMGLPFRPHEWAMAMGAILEDREVYAQLAHRGREFAETRQWRDVAQRWIELFRTEQGRS